MIAGIVCEYNPFHNGHLFQINQAKKMGANYIVCVMSGNFVQRGECAVMDKWKRAEIAIMNGADAVIDLPVPWACSSAENFAFGSMTLLNNFGIDALSFGCECDNVDLLNQCANAVSDADVIDKTREYIKSGLTYPLALYKAIFELNSKETADIIKSPNNTLAVEYIRARNKLNPKIKLLPVKRIAVSHDSEDFSNSFMSASAIRNNIFDNSIFDFMPKNAQKIINEAISENEMPCKIENIERSVIADLRRMSLSEIREYISDENGLAERIKDSAKGCESLGELYDTVKVKNYTHSRIRREILNAYLRIPKNISEVSPDYIRILAVSEKGLSLLKSAQKNSSLPIITKHSEMQKLGDFAKEVYDIQCRSTDIFALCSKKIRACSLEQTHSLNIIR